MMAAPMVEGLQGKPGEGRIQTGHVAASAKHFLGDGGGSAGTQELSRTRSPGLVAMWMTLSIKASGLGVSKEASVGNSLRISFLDVRLLPTSSFFQSVRGTKSETSDR